MKHFFKILLTLTPLLFIDAAKSDVIYNIRFNPKPEAALQWNQNVDITFDYKTSEAGGIKVFAHPMSSDSLAANYSVSNSPLYRSSGTGNQSFTITSGKVFVDKVRFQVYNANQTLLILEFCVPVKFYFGAHAIYNIQLSPATHTTLRLNQYVNLAFNYKTTQGGGVLIFAIPMVVRPSSASYAYSASPVYPTGSGSISPYFTVFDDTADVYGIEFLMRDKNQTTTLLDFVVPVKYKFSPYAISNIVISPSTSTGLLLNEQVNVSFTYSKPATDTVTIYSIPYSNGSITPYSGFTGAIIRGTSSGSSTSRFTIARGSVSVDSVHFVVSYNNYTQALLNWPVPVNLHFASSKITAIAFNPTSMAYFTNNEQVNISFDYTTSEAGGIKIIARPKSGSFFTPSSISSESPVYSTGNGSGTNSFTFTGGTTTVDSVCFQTYDATQTTLLDEFVVPVKFYFGSQPLTGVTTNSSEVLTEFRLSQNYPNPFNPSTNISYQLSVTSNVSLKVFDILGREILTLVNERKTAGSYQVQWNAAGMPSGIYFYRMQAGYFSDTKKLILVK
jgi:hypothetical protein